MVAAPYIASVGCLIYLNVWTRPIWHCKDNWRGCSILTESKEVVWSRTTSWNCSILDCNQVDIPILERHNSPVNNLSMYYWKREAYLGWFVWRWQDNQPWFEKEHTNIYFYTCRAAVAWSYKLSSKLNPTSYYCNLNQRAEKHRLHVCIAWTSATGLSRLGTARTKWRDC